LIRYLLEQGFHISNVFGNIPDENGSKATNFTEAEKSTIKNTALILAINRKFFKVVDFLTSEAFINWWNTKDLKAKVYKLLSQGLTEECITYLRSPFSQNIYLLTYNPNQK